LASTIEEETRNTIPTADNNNELRKEVDRLLAQISRLMQERSPLPTTKSDPNSFRQPYHTLVVRFQSETPSLLKVKLSERTPTIDCLTDGKEPTFRQ
jgi:hypothetical protein